MLCNEYIPAGNFGHDTSMIDLPETTAVHRTEDDHSCLHTGMAAGAAAELHEVRLFAWRLTQLVSFGMLNGIPAPM